VIATFVAYVYLSEVTQEPATVPQVATSANSELRELAGPSVTPCQEDSQIDAEPLNSGPASLTKVTCVTVPGYGLWATVVISPDAKSMAFWVNGRENLVDLINMETGFGSRLFNRVKFRDFGQRYSEDAIAWRSDGLALWSIEQEVQEPAGWALSGLTPILIDEEGKVERFAPPQHQAGPLDGIDWVGGDGLAIAKFGTKGSYYRPVRGDISPTLAMIDVPDGKILDTIVIDDAEVLQQRAASNHDFNYFSSASVQLPDGRIRTLLQFPRVVDRTHGQDAKARSNNRRFLPAAWLTWTQGERPVEIPAPFGFSPAHFELAPDGAHALVWRPLQPEGVIHIECFEGCPPMPEVTPVKDTIAALVDTETGDTLWKVEATAREAWNTFGGTVISPTGEFALIALPSEGRRQMIALLSMNDGRILQRFSPSCSGCFTSSFGFTRGGGQMWIAAYGSLAFYNLSQR